VEHTDILLRLLNSSGHDPINCCCCVQGCTS